MASATSTGSVTIDCPICGRSVTLSLTTEPPDEDSHPQCIARLVLDMNAVLAHLLTHSQHDGEPLPLAA